MTTHFRPRPSTSAPQSPARPGSARPTIRAITPSPPQDSSGATNGSRAQSEKPHVASPEGKEQPLMRPRSEEISRARNLSLKGEEIGTAHDVARNHGRLQSGGPVMARRSPIKRQDRSKSRRGRTNTSPTTRSSQHKILDNDRTDKKEDGSGDINQYEAKKVQGYHNKEIPVDCPDTPTPMTLSQKRSAYLPLVSPTPIVLPERSLTAESSPDAVSTAAKSAVNQGPSPNPYASSTNVKKPLADDTMQRTNPLAQHPHIHSHISLADNIDEKTKPTAPQPLRKTYHLPFNTNPQTTVPQTNAVHPAPPQTRVQAAARKPIPASSTPARHLTSLSGVSNNSDGTTQSQRSVFSTPGRDELERKKAMVEVDEGPFGRVVSVAQLNEARRVVSGGEVSDDDEEYGGKDRKREKRCGMSVGCSVM